MIDVIADVGCHPPTDFLTQMTSYQGKQVALIFSILLS